MHVLLLQQPPVQAVGSHLHVPPPMHSCPKPQVVQLPPPVPQYAALGAWQVPPASQQPLGQDAALQTQTPLTQAWPVAHTAHVPPLAPQWFALEVSQPPLSQQPLGQEWASQTHAPLEHSVPVRHLAQVVPFNPQ